MPSYLVHIFLSSAMQLPYMRVTGVLEQMMLNSNLLSAGFWAYLVSRWAPERKAAFYSVHRFLGSATLLTAFTAILVALEEVQTFDLFAKYGIKAFFDSPKPYSLISVVLPIMALLILSQAVVVLYNLVHGQQMIPPGKAAPAQNGVHAKAGPGNNGVIGSV